MPWDDAKPKGSIPVAQLDNETRDQFQFLKLVLQQSMEFPGTGGDPPTGTGGTPLLASARIHVGQSPLGGGPTDADISQGTARSTGKVRFMTDNGQVKICTDGAADTWQDISGVAGTLAVGGALNVAGLLGINGGAVLPSGQTMLVPPGESWLSDSSTTMEPHAHVGRHAIGAEDELTNLVRFAKGIDTTDVQFPGDGTGFADFAEASVDFTGRSGDSTVAVVATMQIKPNGVFAPHGVKLRIRQNAASDADSEIALGITNRGNDTPRGGGSTMSVHTDVSAAAHTFTAEAEDASSGSNRCRHIRSQLIIMDYGLT